MKEGEYIVEFGSSSPINFAEGTMYTADGEVFDDRCKCGKRGAILIGGESFMFICADCADKKYGQMGEKGLSQPQ
jgi:hypothetical protein